MTRDSASSALPTGTVTFLFSDIEGSTRLVQSLGEGFPPLLEKQADLIRDVLRRRGGVEVATEGDSFFIAFPSAPSAVAAAADIQRVIAEATWPEDVSVAIRIGLHTGEGLLVGDNYGGLDVHRAARIAAVGHGGQIVLSAATANLVRSSLPEGAELVDLGMHRLKDLVAEEHLFQLDVPGLRSEFPPIRSLESRPNNLPVELTSFVGREREIDEILQMLRANRFVTLTGPGGTGKTRLSLQVAARSLSDHPNGVFLVLLAAITEPHLVPSTIAEELGVQEEKGRDLPIEKTLLSYLRDKDLLLVLDNFEQIVDAAPFVAELLASCPHVKVLVTSRAALRVGGEHEYSVPPLVLPNPADLPSVSLLLQYESVALFVQRAAAVKTGFTLTEENAAAVVSICERLDGLPLAIELAAARVRILTPASIADRLKACLELLTGGGRDLPERQQTLRGAIDWSYDLLDETYKRFFSRLSVFVNGFTFEAVDRVCNPGGEVGVDTLDALTQLVDSSLVRQFETRDGQARFRILQVIREYAIEKLRDSGELDELGARHAIFFTELAEELESGIARADAGVLARIELEHDNLRAVLARSLELDEAELGLRAGAAIWRFWMMRSHLAEGREWLDRLLALPSAQAPVATRARGLDAAASIAYWQRDFDPVRPYYEEALAIYRDLGDDAGIAAQTYNLGFAHALAYDDDTALAYLEEARERFEKIGHTARETDAIWAWSWISLVSRRLAESLPAAQEALRRYTEQGNNFGIGSCLLTLARLDFELGNMESAWKHLQEALESFSDPRDLGDISSILKQWSNFELVEGNHERSAIILGAAVAGEERYGGGAPEAIARHHDPLPALHAVLGPEELDRLLAEGRALSPEEAIAFARKRDD